MSLSSKGQLSGKKNPTAVAWKLINPNGKIYLFTGSLYKTCKQLQISPITLRKNLGDNVLYNKWGRGNTFKNTIGWCLKKEDK